MRASLYSPPPPHTSFAPETCLPRDPNAPLFQAFSAAAFAQAQARRVPVFLLIGEEDVAFRDPSVHAQLAEHTVPVRLPVGVRPDVELLCQRAAALFSGEGALPLCALLLHHGLPFLAAPLPPHGYTADPSRLLIWLTHACRRFAQNSAAFTRQAQDVLRSFAAPPLAKPYSPKDAAHDLMRALLAASDPINGGFGQVKAPNVSFLRFLSKQSTAGSREARDLLHSALRAMKTGALFDPVDGLYFRATLTADWRVFIPEKPLAVNALLALTLMEDGERSDAMRLLDAILAQFSLPGGVLAPALRADKARYSFSPEQVCALLGDEEGLRACRLLGLLHQRRSADPPVAPSRFSPPIAPQSRATLDTPQAALTPCYPTDPVAEDAAFLRRVLPKLARGRAARPSESPVTPTLTMDAALTAVALARCAQRTGNPRYVQAAQNVVHALMGTIPQADAPGALPATAFPAPAQTPPECGAAAALSLALLTLGMQEPSGAFAAAGLRMLGAALHTFVRPDGMVMHTPPAAAGFPRVPALWDSELPSPAALLVHALCAARTLHPDAAYDDAINALYDSAAPFLRREPLACASLISAFSEAQ